MKISFEASFAGLTEYTQPETGKKFHGVDLFFPGEAGGRASLFNARIGERPEILSFFRKASPMTPLRCSGLLFIGKDYTSISLLTAEVRS